MPEPDFYTIEHECISCGVPAMLAPDLIAQHEEHGSCYFLQAARDLSRTGPGNSRRQRKLCLQRLLPRI